MYGEGDRPPPIPHSLGAENFEVLSQTGAFR